MDNVRRIMYYERDGGSGRFYRPSMWKKPKLTVPNNYRRLHKLDKVTEPFLKKIGLRSLKNLRSNNVQFLEFLSDGKSHIITRMCSSEYTKCNEVNFKRDQYDDRLRLRAIVQPRYLPERQCERNQRKNSKYDGNGQLVT